MTYVNIKLVEIRFDACVSIESRILREGVNKWGRGEKFSLPDKILSSFLSKALVE